ncbi:dolichyl-diphosphooligosaccharide--protein glycosyltransferase subunit 1 [Condylostylus longicornis]|uniref:dolichyl-diphosphooligosaccharide--protein glycosyltransferase subunit 1 n=1 Tax=Condylostylus longicornis TaxID=2530218 RepID=UPI00244DA0B4|nr:dolichyl-diphosphooligosaccharide--protein glycosyltransferase subunit 1 [Condylostylus longicornis]
MWKHGLIFMCLIAGIYCAVDTAIENKKVERTIDLTSQLVKVYHKINLGRTDNGVISAYTFVLTEDEKNHLAYLSAKDGSKKELKLTESKTSNGWEYLVSFSNPAATQTLYIEAVYTKMLQAYPASITQSEKQLVRYFGNLYFFSPYKTVNQETSVYLSSRNVESYTQIKPVSMSESTISYGNYENIAPFTTEELVIHYENHSPFLIVSRLERTIEISHWGNIAIEETIDILHSGAKLKGSFSRSEFQKDTRNSLSAVKSYKTILPASATGVYYRDTNGNISTSNMKILKDSVELDLKPRFPLFGGWKTHYTLGYNVPSFEYLFNNGDNYLLKMRAIDHVFDDMTIDEAIVKIILPEGCTNIKLITPYPITRLPDTLHYTYLDTFGRPVISFSKRNLVENHIHDFNLKYNFAKITMLQEPLLVVSFLFVLFVIVIICMRLDFSIVKEKEIHHHKD